LTPPFAQKRTDKKLIKYVNYNSFKFIKFPNSVGIGPVSGFPPPTPLFLFFELKMKVD